MNSVYPAVLDRLLTGGLDWTSDTIRMCAVGAGYVYDDDDTYRSELAAVIATANVNNRGADNGATADAVTFTAVAAGSTIRAFVVFADTGSPALSPLIAYIDTLASGAPISIVTDNGDVVVDWSAAVFQP